MSTAPAINFRNYVGLFFITLATLMFEILLTRIFSVTMWYHFAFFAISMGMFGMTVGAILVYLFPKLFEPEMVNNHLALSSLLFSLFILIGVLFHIYIPFIPGKTIANILGLVFTFIIISIPFIFSGIAVCLSLTRFPRAVGKLYAADLAGAAVGCILLIFAFKIIDGLSAIVMVALLAAIGAVFFSLNQGKKTLFRISLGLGLILLALSVTGTLLADRQSPLLHLKWVKGTREDRALYEKWNSFSRVAVFGNANLPLKPFGWGLSPALILSQGVRQLYMNIDATAITVMTKFDGDFRDVEFLKYDVTNVAHYIRPDSRILVIGAGGGRDILSALAFNQKSVVGVEINEDIINIVNRRFGDFTGHLDRYPQVKFVNDEARSYIARTSDRFDIIQISLIDTYSATAAGAFVLTENSLYTIEAWTSFLNHLTPDGILAVSRWYFPDSPGEVYRMVSLAKASFEKLGITDIRKHILLVKCMGGQSRDVTDGVGTILVSRSPFSENDVGNLNDIAKRLRFSPVLTPGYAEDSIFAALASEKAPSNFLKDYPLNLSAPDDDNPFFFHMLRLDKIFDSRLQNQGVSSFNFKAVYILGVLLIMVVVLNLLCIILPLLPARRAVQLGNSMPHLGYFLAIGFGFMFVEISQMQRMVLFLGHPVYSLSVVLFTLLLSGGLGSWTTQKTAWGILDFNRHGRLIILTALLLLFGLMTPYILGACQGQTTPLRIAIVIGLLSVPGFFMGMAFPLGMKAASVQAESMTPWLWGINGAASVCASVLAIAIAITWGISAAFWTGFGCYIAALILSMNISRKALRA